MFVRVVPLLRLSLGCVFLASCAASTREAGQHGTISDLSVAGEAGGRFCEHRVPAEVCARCNPRLVARFKAARDWCGEHDVPESQCWACHPDLSFEPLPTLRDGADVADLSTEGEDVASLERHVVPGKVTLFDFHATWCAPCRRVDAHLRRLLNARDDVAVRRLDIVSWDSPLARHHLASVESLPYLVVYGRDGAKVRAIVGLDLEGLDRAIAEGAAR